MSSLLKDKEDEEYKKKLEEARKLRQSMGIVTSRDIENGYDVNENTISLNNDSDYQKRLQEAKDIRHSMGIMTPREMYEIEKNPSELNIQNEDNTLIDNYKVNNNIANNEDTNNSFWDKAGYIGKKTAAGLATGTVGIAQAITNDIENNLKKGENKNTEELKKSISDEISLPSATLPEKLFNIILDKDKNFFQKLGSIK